MTRRGLLTLAGAGIVGSAAAGAGAAVSFVAVGEFKFANRFYPGVQMDGEDIGGLTLEQAMARARARWDPFLASPIVFRLGDREWIPAAAQVGIAVDYAGPLRAAYAWGREGSWDTRFAEQRATAEAARGWRTLTSFDPHVFTEYIESIAAEVYRPAADASVRVEVRGGRRQVAVEESVVGQRLVDADYLSVASQGFESPRRVIVDLAVEDTLPGIATDMVAPVSAEAERLMRGHINLVSDQGRWSIGREDLATDLAIGGAADAPELEVRLDYQGFARVASQIVDELRVDPVDPKIRVNAAGRVVPTVEGRLGRSVDVEGLWSRVQAAMTSGADEVRVPLVVLQPDITRLTAADLQFDNLIAEGHSFFWGSAENRMHNIDNGSAKIDGTVVAPGEQFSLNAVVGLITEANGFVEGLVIAPNRTEPGVGGGICQVSTTLFRALFWAGLPIDERWQHVYRVGYYELGPEHPPGFDAAIWQPSQDLRFTNDTPNHLLIRREFDEGEGELRFKIMGAPLGRTVELEAWQGKLIEPPPLRVAASEELEPGELKQTDKEVAGLQAIIYRNVSVGGRTLFKDRYPSEFVAWPERWEVGQNPDGSVDFSAVPGYVPPDEEPAANSDEVLDEGAAPDAAE